MEYKLLNKIINRRSVFFFFILFHAFLYSQLFAKSASVSGKVLANRIVVKQALVTFIDNNDTTNKFSAVTDDQGDFQINVVTSLTSQHQIRSFSLEQNYPNPFSSSTVISYKLKTQSNARVTIYDILGREIKRFTLGLQSIGGHAVVWDGKNEFGKKVSPGIYFYRLQAGSKSIVKKMLYNASFNNHNIAQPGLALSKSTPGNSAIIENTQVVNYTVRIENTSNTLPYVIKQQFSNIAVYNDTTINFTVDYLPTAAIDFDSLHQRIRGFGAANIVYWYPDMTESEIQTAFGTGYGQLGFTILRLMVDPNSNTWGQNIATAKAAYDMGAIIFASPWNAPAEMTEVVGNRTRVRPDMYAEYAAHLDSFATFMANNGVPLYCISVQNEPDYGAQGNWTDWTENEMFTFMRDYAQLITATKVMAPESYQFRRQMSDPILNDSTACANLGVVGGHIYGGGLAPYPLAEQKGKEVWMTEHYTESANSANLWPLALDVATEMNSVMLVDWNAYIWWQIVRYYSPISDGQKEGDIAGTVTKRGYIMSQYSKYIRPGDYRVDSSIFPTTSGIAISAYRDSMSSKEVIIAINTNSTSQDVFFALPNHTKTFFTPYTTSEFKSASQGEDISISSDKIILNLDASSITTFVSQ